jgi:hypothetical protein
MPDFRRRLTRAQQRHYDRSNRIAAIPLRVSARSRAALVALRISLRTGDRSRTQGLSQIICDEVCAALRVRSPRVKAEGVRRSRASGELHGLFSTGPAIGDRIQVWMFTAKRRQSVAFKTFVRTLLHEVCHHLDYVLLGLHESFHTDGFFKRESSLFRQLTHGLPAAAGAERDERPHVGATGDFELTGLVSGEDGRYVGQREST